MPRTPETFDLLALRKSLKLSQAEMAKRMGLGSRAYFSIETEPETIKPRHVRLAESVSLDVALEKADPMLATASMRRKIEAWQKAVWAEERSWIWPKEK